MGGAWCDGAETRRIDVYKAAAKYSAQAVCRVGRVTNYLLDAERTSNPNQDQQEAADHDERKIVCGELELNSGTWIIRVAR